MRSRSIALSCSPAALSAAVLAGAAGAQTAPAPALNLSPSQFPGILTGPLQVGPMTLLNGTQTDYRIRVFPVLLGQRRDGGIFVREEARDRRRAGRVVVVQTRRFDLVPGEARSVFSRVRRVPRSGSFHGGVLFKATPRVRPSEREQITNILQLNASVLLDPVAARRRLRYATEPIRSESPEKGQLRLLVPVSNRGNVYRRVGAAVVVRDGSGEVAARTRVKGVKILPGAIVDLSAVPKEKLPAGDYTLSATLRGTGRAVRAKGSMRLFGVNAVATRTARLMDFDSPTAFRGQEVEVKASFENTGNVPYAPEAELLVRSAGGEEPGAVVKRRPMEVDRAEPGETGAIQTEVELPDDARSYQLTVRLLAGTRLIDSRDVSVTPTERPPVLTRAKNWVTENAVVVVGVLLVALIIGGIAGLGYVRRLKRAGARPG
ncbi:MAG: hypothetical protein M3417_00270 [Actinomycetota bacterium]|nr:hypothetical protein [Actinomycetota bacterium]